MVVGGSALVATITIIMRGNKGLIATMITGIIMMGYIIVEVLILKQVPPGPTTIEIFYFVLGLFLFGLGGYLWNVEVRQPSETAVSERLAIYPMAVCQPPLYSTEIPVLPDANPVINNRSHCPSKYRQQVNCGVIELEERRIVPVGQIFPSAATSRNLHD